MKQLTVASLVETFMEEHARPKLKPLTVGTYAGLFNQHLVPKLGAGRHTSLLPTSLGCTVDHEPRRPAPIACGSGEPPYTFAAKRRLVHAGLNPAAGLDRYKESGRERFLSTDELGRIGEMTSPAPTPWRRAGAAPPADGSLGGVCQGGTKVDNVVPTRAGKHGDVKSDPAGAQALLLVAMIGAAPVQAADASVG